MNAKQATAIVSGIIATGLFLVGFLSALFGETGTAISYMTASIVASILYIITMDKE
jgi:CHASE2 domain-containing sensor protein